MSICTCRMYLKTMSPSDAQMLLSDAKFFYISDVHFMVGYLDDIIIYSLDHPWATFLPCALQTSSTQSFTPNMRSAYLVSVLWSFWATLSPQTVIPWIQTKYPRSKTRGLPPGQGKSSHFWALLTFIIGLLKAFLVSYNHWLHSVIKTDCAFGHWQSRQHSKCW